MKYKAGKREPAPKPGRRVALSRPGGSSRPGKNRRREAPVRRNIHLPWGAICNTISAFGLLALIIIILGGVAFGLLYGYRSVTAGEYFALRTLEIRGNSRLSSREILETADLTEGANTLALSIDAVESALSAHPWVKEVSVKRVLPGTLIISVREREPAFWMLYDGALHYADAYGKVIGPVLPGHFASLPTLEVEPGAQESARALPDLVKSLNDSRLLQGLGAVTLMRLSASRGVDVYVEGAGLKLSIGLEDWLSNLRRLALTLKDLNRRGELGRISEIRAQGVNVWVERKTAG